jgi:RNA polymerase sigma-70 factor (ECF subfamily)
MNKLVQATLSGDDGCVCGTGPAAQASSFRDGVSLCPQRSSTGGHRPGGLHSRYKNLSQFRKDAPFEHWLARITFSACYDFLRRERKHRETAPLDAVDFDLYDNSADQAVAAGRAREVLAWAMRHLRADEQLVLTLCEIEERTIREVADLTGWSESNVKVRAFRARQALKRILEEHAER